MAKESGADVVVVARVGKERVVGEVQKVTCGRRVDATVNIAK